MEPLIHLVIPPLLVMAAFPKLRKKALLLIPIAFIMDFDFFLGHRGYFHNIFFVIGLASVVYLISKKDKDMFNISLFYSFAHIILDLGFMGVPLFYPVYTGLFGFNFNIFLTKQGALGSELEGSSLGFEAIHGSYQVPIVTIFGVLVFLSLLVILIAKYWKKRNKWEKVN